jgi:hypothetical protein
MFLKKLKEDDYSITSSEGGLAPAPFLRKGMSSYDPEVVKKEEQEFQKKKEQLESLSDYKQLFEIFTETDKKELEKLDYLTKIFLFLRKHITNPIIS